MKSLKNRVQLIGHLGANPEMRKVGNSKVANFSLATNDSYIKQDGKKEELTQWHSVAAWGKLAEICEKYLKKGKEVAIEGRIVYDEWTDKNGLKRISTNIVASDLLLIGKKAD